MNDEQKKQQYSEVQDQEIRPALDLSPQVLEVVLACSCANRQHAKPNEMDRCQQASAATIVLILKTAGSQRAVFFRRRRSLSFIISFKSATGRISIGPSPYLKPGSCETS